MTYKRKHTVKYSNYWKMSKYFYVELLDEFGGHLES